MDDMPIVHILIFLHIPTGHNYKSIYRGGSGMYRGGRGGGGGGGRSGIPNVNGISRGGASGNSYASAVRNSTPTK